MASTEAGERIYAIGDVHGRFDLLQLMMARIGAHNAALPPARALHVVLVGDVIDRGPASGDTLAMLHDLTRRTDRVVVLMGNHEELMLRALQGEGDELRGWLAVGGAATLRSLGVEPPGAGKDPRDVVRRLRAAVPPGWLGWLKRLPVSVRSGDYLFVHAGIRPGVAIGRQARKDLLWIRDDFLDDPRDHGAVVVHGHTIVPQVEWRANRIAIDTGAYRSGLLSAVYLEGDRRELIEVRLPAPAAAG